MNKVCLTGRTTKDIELRYTPAPNSIAVGSFTLAVNRRFKNKDGNYDADFINCVAFRSTAETLNKYVKKGDMLGVEGHIQTRTYDAQDGSKRYVTEVMVDNIDFLQPKKDDTQSGQARGQVEDIPQNYTTDYDEDSDIQLSDDDLPF